jgi:hypothetical protein
MSSGLGLKGRAITTRLDLEAVRKAEMWESNDNGGSNQDISGWSVWPKIAMPRRILNTTLVDP